MDISKLTREFVFGDIRLPDPNPKYTVERVLSFYTEDYPELVNATVSEPNVSDETLTYEFKVKVGTKG